VHTTGAFISFRYTGVNPHVLIVYECVFIQFADVLEYSSSVELYDAVDSGFNS